MAGLYLHIPFCRQSCHYCNFHFSTSLKNKDAMIAAMLQELELQKEYLDGEPLESIYFGGGTPSLLGQHDLDRIFDKIYLLYPMAASSPLFIPEITLEANPDDLNLLKIRELKETPVNRLSIGIQSFADEDLRFMNRAHNAAEALTCLENVRCAGFSNLTVDLIYGSPTTSDEQWEKNLDLVFRQEIPHFSCYCLTVEEKTALAHFIKTGKSPAIDEEKAARQFEFLMKQAVSAGYEQYEISNFARPGWHSRHNSNYWQGKKYLGIGPSAHSFNGTSRQWNVANNARYIQSINNGSVPFEMETLTPEQCYNEYVMTSLRTIWGSDLQKIEALGGHFKQHFLKNVKQFLDISLLENNAGNYKLTFGGKLFADRISAALFIEN
jgi:oxygen-independent coproporphyrinogen-3 oxidase